MSKKIWIIALVLVGSFLLVNGKDYFFTQQTNSANDKAIIIGYSNYPGWLPWAIAESESLFAKHDLNVELKWYDDYAQSKKDLAAGVIDGNCQSLSDTIVAAPNSAKGEVIVLITDSSIGNDKIIAEAGINSVEDLKGKTVAVEDGADDFLLTLALNEVGLSVSDVEILKAETGAGVEAFIVDQADAVRAFPPFWFRAFKKQGAKEIISSDQLSLAILNLLVVTQDLIDQQPVKVQSLIDTWFDVINFTYQNLDESDEIMARRAAISPKTIKLLKSGTKMYRLEDNLTAFKNNDHKISLYHAAQNTADFIRNRLNVLDQNRDLSNLIDPRFIKKLD